MKKVSPSLVNLAWNVPYISKRPKTSLRDQFDGESLLYPTRQSLQSLYKNTIHTNSTMFIHDSPPCFSTLLMDVRKLFHALDRKGPASQAATVKSNHQAVSISRHTRNIFCIKADRFYLLLVILF